MASSKKKKPSEKAIETAILTYLNYLPQCFAWKNNSTGIYDPSRGCYRRNRNKFVINGVADILGLYHGRLLAIEVKRDRAARVSNEQHDFLKKVQDLGGIAGICCSVDDARELIKTSGGKHVSNIEGISE
ncbi:hypothetical protein [Zhongshania sp.]|uniref:hypothetical protein n=1 Tax=Zhongshania sp. TaxID=1971902 RepID=UPI003569281C